MRSQFVALSHVYLSLLSALKSILILRFDFHIVLNAFPIEASISHSWINDFLSHKGSQQLIDRVMSTCSRLIIFSCLQLQSHPHCHFHFDFCKLEFCDRMRSIFVAHGNKSDTICAFMDVTNKNVSNEKERKMSTTAIMIYPMDAYCIRRDCKMQIKIAIDEFERKMNLSVDSI